MYTSLKITDFNLICIFEFAFKHMLTPFYILFLVLKTRIVNLINVVTIIIRFNIFMCFLFCAYFNIFLQEDFIHFLFNNSIVILLPVNFFNACRVVPTVIIRPNFGIIRTKVSQELALI